MEKRSKIQVKEQSSTTHTFNRRDFLATSLKIGVGAFTTGLLPNLSTKAARQFNVLFFIVDDLQALLGCYGHPEMHTPNIDALAQRGTLFNRAYCQFPLCNPSRASVLTGLRPDTTRVLDNYTSDFRQTVPDAVTLPEYFKAHGYETRSVGKVTHGPAAWEDELSWSTPIWRERWKSINKPRSPSWQAFDVADDQLGDGRIANVAVETLTEIKDLPFFLAVGFNKPHLPFYAPSKYFDLYTTQDFKLPADTNLPQNTPDIASNPKSLKRWQDVSKNPPLSDQKTLELTRAYAANISYVDAQIGLVLDRLEGLGLTENTITVFWSDHGYHLGEHGIWRKNTLFEVCLRSPMIISVPGQQSAETDALAELVDLYPTLCDACQIPIPADLEGISLMPVIDQPTFPWKTAAFSQLSRGSVMGYSMCTERYRYTEWGPNGTHGRELYDYDTDPDETVNIADLPENAELTADLSKRLRVGWQGALPDTSQHTPISQTLPWDINSDGIIDNQDLILVAQYFGTKSPEHPKVDVNKDGQVNIVDLLIVAGHFGESVNPGAPEVSFKIPPEHLDVMEEWLAEARLADDGSDLFRQGIITLEHLINTVSPTKTVLLPNYPNPFNPETWIPYDLAEDAEVHIYIHNMKGESIRRLSLGFQPAGTYRTRTRAAYWDGRNSVGERVASGSYFYTLHVGQTKTTRRMVILK